MKVRKADALDVVPVYNLICDVTLDKEMFIKNTRAEVLYILEVGRSYVLEVDGVLKGVCLVLVRGILYIDTIVSCIVGGGSLMLSSLPIGKYGVNISKKNVKSQRLFKKFGFEFVKDENICGEERGYYEGNL